MLSLIHRAVSAALHAVLSGDVTSWQDSPAGGDSTIEVQWPLGEGR